MKFKEALEIVFFQLILLLPIRPVEIIDLNEIDYPLITIKCDDLMGE